MCFLKGRLVMSLPFFLFYGHVGFRFKLLCYEEKYIVRWGNLGRIKHFQFVVSWESFAYRMIGL